MDNIYANFTNSELHNMIKSYREKISDIRMDIKAIKTELANRKDPILLLEKTPYKDGFRPLLGLNNKIIYRPSAYCHLKQVYLLSDDIKEKECLYKNCKYLDYLNKDEQKKGIKSCNMKLFEGKINDEKNNGINKERN